MCKLHIYSMPSSTHLTAPSLRWPTPVLGALALLGTWAVLPAPVFLLLVLAPVLEETVFRAGLQEQLLQHRSPRPALGALRANLLTALAFAAAHVLLHPGLLACLTFFPALLVGALYQRQRRLAPCIALHAAFNVIWLVWAEHAINLV